MNVLDLLQRQYTKSTIRRASVFFTDIRKQKAYLASLPEPEDDFQRSFYQYKCQMMLDGPLLTFLINAASIPLYFIYLLRIKDLSETGTAAPDVACYMSGDSMDLIPDSLRERYSIIQEPQPKKHLSLTAEDRHFIRELGRRYPHSWHFRLKCMLKTAMFSYQLGRDCPAAVIVDEEFSFTSSVLTAYCERRGVKLINIMHGEKLYHIRDSFFRFHECFVWDQYYVGLFTRLRAAEGQFTVELPLSQRPWPDERPEKTVDYTYYLGDEDRERMMKVRRSLAALKDKGAVVAVRPHPLYSDSALAGEIFAEYIVENNAETGIRQSVLRTRNAVSAYSTVLQQARINGVRHIVDDVTDKEHYEKLYDLEYIVVRQPHCTLSEEITKGKEG